MSRTVFPVTSPLDGAVRDAWAVDSSASETRGVVQILHGMAEHKERYAEFAAFLSEAGYAVVAHDHRGHGRNEPDESRNGFFASSGGWQAVVSDVFAVRAWIVATYPGVPIYLFGHSMGSFIARSCMIRDAGAYAGYILCGTASHPGLAGHAGRTLARLLSARGKEQVRSPLLSSLTSHGFNRDFAPNRTAYDWLSRDESEVDEYIADPACGFIPCRAFFRDMVGGLIEVNTHSNLAAIRDAVPVLLIAGGKDPVGGSGQGVERVAAMLRAHTPCEVCVRMFPDDRHELLKELDRTEVFRAVSAWLGAHAYWGNRPTRTNQ